MLFARPSLRLHVTTVPKDRAARMWHLKFATHHYLDKNLHTAAVCYLATLSVDCGDGAVDAPEVGRQGEAVFSSSYPLAAAFIGFLTQQVDNREHRLVVLPCFQGLGLGSKLSDAIARDVVERLNGRYVSHTAHYLLRNHREQSESWRKRHHDGAVRHDPGVGGKHSDAAPALSRQEYVGAVARTRVFITDLCKGLAALRRLSHEAPKKWNNGATGGWLDTAQLGVASAPTTAAELSEAIAQLVLHRWGVSRAQFRTEVEMPLIFVREVESGQERGEQFGTRRPCRNLKERLLLRWVLP